MNKPYGLLADKRIKALFTFGLSTFILIFLFLLEPFGLVFFSPLIEIKLIFSYCFFGFCIIAIHLYLLQDYFIKKYTVASTIIWLTWIHFVIALSNFFIFITVINTSEFKWRYFPRMFLQTVLVGSIPTAFIIFIYNFYYLKKQIKTLNLINSNLALKDGNNKNEVISLSSTALREVMNFYTDSLLYITSADNYVEINWIEKDLVKNSLLRNTLANVEKDLASQCSFIKRCHQSYIVNLSKVKYISGNEAGYKIFLDCIDFPIPISRKYKDSIFKYLKK